jgi:nucleoside-diphosphate-sugar epimerase
MEVVVGKEAQMRVFVTGASGFIGAAVIAELRQGGHHVVGLARSPESASRVEALGATPFVAGLDDLGLLTQAADESAGVIHLAYGHGSPPDEAAAADRRAIETLGSALAGSDRPLVITGGTLVLPAGRTGTERDRPDPEAAATGRGASEPVALALAERGVRASVVRLAPCVHDRARRGFAGALIDAAQRTGVSGYVGDGSQRWPAVHRQDAATLFRLALESAPAGTVLHGVDETGVRLRDIADLIGARLHLPVKEVAADTAPDHFGWIGALVGTDALASSEYTRELLNWRPSHPGLLDDMATGEFFTPAS